MKLSTLWTSIILCLAGCSAPQQAATTPPPTAPALTSTPAAVETTTTLSETAANGKILFTSMQQSVGFACVTCHYPGSEARLIGPGLRNIRERAAAYNPEDSIEAYLRTSIVEPNAFIAPGNPPYKAGLMPQKYASVFSEQEIDALIAYLLTL